MGLISKEVEIGISPTNVDKLEQLGYEIPRYYNKEKRKMVYKKREKIKVKIKDLSKTSQSIVEVECDYCNTKKKIRYKDYNASLNRIAVVPKYCCSNCDHLKKQELVEYKQSNGLLIRGEKGYWTFKENRIKALKEYIEKYNTIHGMQNNKEGALIYAIFTEYKDSIENTCIELGYNYSELLRFQREETYYDSYDNLQKAIQGMCINLGRFPKQKEVLQHLHISNVKLLKFGGIRNIKNMMGIIDNLIDDNGFINRSSYEFMVAQLFIYNDITYLREENPFNNTKYKNLRSDFTILINNKPFHIEVWGFPSWDNSSRGLAYSDRKQKKIELYNKYNIGYIGFDYTLFQDTYENIQNNLINILQPYFSQKLKHVENIVFLPKSKITDEELLEEIMKYSNEKDILPKWQVLVDNKKSYLFYEAFNRYGSYFNFAKKFGKYTCSKFNNWTKETIFECFKYMISNYGYILTDNEIRNNKEDNKIKGIIDGANNIFNNFVDSRLEFYKYAIDSNIKIGEKDIIYLNNLVNIRRGFNRKTSTPERINIAIDILSKYL